MWMEMAFLADIMKGKNLPVTSPAHQTLFSKSYQVRRLWTVGGLDVRKTVLCSVLWDNGFLRCDATVLCDETEGTWLKPKRQANPSKRLVQFDVCFYRKAYYKPGRVKGPNACNLLAKKHPKQVTTSWTLSVSTKTRRPPHPPLVSSPCWNRNQKHKDSQREQKTIRHQTLVDEMPHWHWDQAKKLPRKCCIFLVCIEWSSELLCLDWENTISEQNMNLFPFQVTTTAYSLEQYGCNSLLTDVECWTDAECNAVVMLLWCSLRCAWLAKKGATQATLFGWYGGGALGC